MTMYEYAWMVSIMRRDQKIRDQNLTQAAAMTASHGERAVDKATKQILDDAPPSEPEPVVAHHVQ